MQPEQQEQAPEEENAGQKSKEQKEEESAREQGGRRLRYLDDTWIIPLTPREIRMVISSPEEDSEANREKRNPQTKGKTPQTQNGKRRKKRQGKPSRNSSKLSEARGAEQPEPAPPPQQEGATA